MEGAVGRPIDDGPCPPAASPALHGRSAPPPGAPCRAPVPRPARPAISPSGAPGIGRHNAAAGRLDRPPTPARRLAKALPDGPRARLDAGARRRRLAREIFRDDGPVTNTETGQPDILVQFQHLIFIDYRLSPQTSECSKDSVPFGPISVRPPSAPEICQSNEGLQRPPVLEEFGATLSSALDGRRTETRTARPAPRRLAAPEYRSERIAQVAGVPPDPADRVAAAHGPSRCPAVDGPAEPRRPPRQTRSEPSRTSMHRGMLVDFSTFSGTFVVPIAEPIAATARTKSAIGPFRKSRRSPCPMTSERRRFDSVMPPRMTPRT